MNYTLAITTYNRDVMTLESFAKVLNDDRISEIWIVDDRSEEEIFDRLQHRIWDLKSKKISMYRNKENLGMMLNKRKAIELSSNEWVIIFDSDNIMAPSYLDVIPKKLDPDVIYCPSFARPTFDYRKFAGSLIDAKKARSLVNDRMGNACLNTCNYLVHRETYLKVFQEDKSVKATDTIAFNYLWLKAGKRFFITPKMEYDHRVHDGSGFMADANFNMKKAEEYKRKILAL